VIFEYEVSFANPAAIYSTMAVCTGIALPASRRAAACALLGDSLYLIGGWDGKEA